MSLVLVDASSTTVTIAGGEGSQPLDIPLGDDADLTCTARFTTPSTDGNTPM